MSPFEDDAARTYCTLIDATDVTHGASENGFRLISELPLPLLPAAKNTLTPRSATARVAVWTGARGSNCWNELPHELLITLTPQRLGWSSRKSYPVTTAVVNSTSPIEMQTSFASGATPMWLGAVSPSAAMIPDTCVP